MLSCGDPSNGYAEFMCPDCHEKKVVAFTCKSSFCLRCGASATMDWVEQVQGLLFAGINYRHVVMTIPEQLRHYFQLHPQLLGDMAKAARQTLTEVMSHATKCELKIGAIAVIQTAGRASNYNPHLHLMVTSEGMAVEGKWREITYVSFEQLHKVWQEKLFQMLEQQLGTAKIRQELKELREKYSKGIVAYWEKEAVKRGKGLAQYLIKYVVSPPIAVSRILSYDGKEVEYYWQDHKSGQQERAHVEAKEFIYLLVQHILSKGFQRVMYLGLHAVSIRKKVADQGKESDRSSSADSV
jgi:diadenosine tetraphosphate (Ap4A) HIT family hydrolase